MLLKAKLWSTDKNEMKNPDMSGIFHFCLLPFYSKLLFKRL